MYELILFACIGAKTCQHIVAPIDYPSFERCHMAAAMIAGQVRGTGVPGRVLAYRYECRPTGLAEVPGGDGSEGAPPTSRLPQPVTDRKTD